MEIKMKFNVNSPILYVLVGIIICFVLAQSVYFLVRALKRAKELGIKRETVKKTVTSAAVFTIAPAVAVLVGVVALSKSLGVALPWLRLSVIGSITYETVAAGNALEAANMGAGNGRRCRLNGAQPHFPYRLRGLGQSGFGCSIYLARLYRLSLSYGAMLRFAALRAHIR